MPSWIFVFFGGGLGSVARWFIARWLTPQEGSFPIGTFVANISACLILGLLMGYHIKYPMAQQHRLLLMMGFCGGFSTFSTFSAEIMILLKSGNHLLSFTYAGASLVAGLIAIYVGIKILSGFE